MDSAAHRSNGFGVAALVLGIVALILSWVVGLGLLLSILALIFGIVALVKRQSKGFGVTGIVLGAIALMISLIVIIVAAVAVKGITTAITNTNTNNPSTSQSSGNTITNEPSKRVVKGTATMLGAGSFVGGVDVKGGLYDVTPGAGESGNFYESGANSYNDILGSDIANGYVTKIRTQISSGDKISISGLSHVTFTPVTVAFVTTHADALLYAGTFVVGEDIGPGRYIVTPAAGESGNFFVDGSNDYNEILGSNSSDGEVPSVSITISNGDKISIEGIDSVTFTAK